jgi:hypothetical protein
MNRTNGDRHRESSVAKIAIMVVPEQRAPGRFFVDIKKSSDKSEPFCARRTNRVFVDAVEEVTL